MSKRKKQHSGMVKKRGEVARTERIERSAKSLRENLHRRKIRARAIKLELKNNPNDIHEDKD